MGEKYQDFPDEEIRQRPFYEPVCENGDCRDAITLTHTGEFVTETLNQGHCKADTYCMIDMARRGKEWNTPNFMDDVHNYDTIYNRILGSALPNEDPHEIFMKRVFKEIHEDLVNYYRTYISFDDERTYDVLAAFTIHSYFKENMPMCPILLVEGVYGSGKSTLMKLLGKVCYRGHVAGNYTCPVLIDILGSYGCTLLLDEAKDNLSSERGREINNFLKLATEKSGSYDRMRTDRAGVMSGAIASYYADVAICTLGGFKEDTRSRGIIITTPVVNETECEDIDFTELFEEFDDTNDPQKISSKLNALRAITVREKLQGKLGAWDSPGINFKDSIKLAHDLLKSGKFGEIEGISGTSPVRNRSLKVISGYYAISMYTDCSKNLVGFLLESEAKKKKDKGTGIYGVVIRALCEVIIFGKEYDEDESGLDIVMDPIGFWGNCHNIRLKTVTERARLNVAASDDNSCLAIIEQNTVTQTLDRLKIPIKEGQGRYKYLDEKHPNFLENFSKAVRQYAPEYQNTFAQILSKPKEVMKVKVVKPISTTVTNEEVD